MPKRRMPKRDGKGHFLKGTAQRDKTKDRPEEKPPGQEDIRGGNRGAEVSNPPQAVDVERPVDKAYGQRFGNLERSERRRCEECGEELEYTLMRSGRDVFDVGRCPRCCPEPPVIMRE